MRNYKLTVAYDGSNYYGYQRQSKRLTVQAVLEDALSKLFRETIKINGAGRTDTGVHALGQVISFTSDNNVPLRNLQIAINNLLPLDIKVCTVEEVLPEFHARYSAVGKHYQYRVLCSNDDNPFNPLLSKQTWRISKPLDIKAMQCATALILGQHDFTSFRSTGSIQGSALRTIYRAEWDIVEECPLNFSQDSDQHYTTKIYVFDIYGSGFLYHMVRNLVGTLVHVGLGKMSVEEFGILFDAHKRSNKCVIAPAQGLYMVKVEY